jgi:hypothetical protein
MLDHKKVNTLKKTSRMPQQHTKEPVNTPDSASPYAGTAENESTIALLEQWAAEDATDDPNAIAQAERELSEFKTALNANRPPDRPLFP